MLAPSTSAQIYAELESLFSAAQLRMTVAGAPAATIRIEQYPWKPGMPIKITLSNINNSDLVCSGKEFWAVVDEYIRRATFDIIQKHLQLGAPVVDNGDAAEDIAE